MIRRPGRQDGGLRFGFNPPHALRLEGEHVGTLRSPRLAILVMPPALLLAQLALSLGAGPGAR